MPTRASSQRSYHHGNLPAALRTATLDLITEHGAQGFNLAEVARRAGVAPSAPYRHFRDRDDLLATIAAEAHEELTELMGALPAGPADATLVRMAVAYVKYAVENRGAFLLLTGAGLDKAQYPRLLAASDQLLQCVLEQASRYCGPRRARAARTLATTLWALAHGHASLAVDGGFGYVGITVDETIDNVTAAARALVDASAAPVKKPKNASTRR